MKAQAHIELFSGCLRVFAHGKSYGDEYILNCSLHWITCEEVELKRITTTCVSPVRYRRVICDQLLNYGVKILRWNRNGIKGNRLIRLDTSTGRTYKEP